MSVTNACVIDAETSVISDIASYADEIAKPPARLKDPVKIAEWIENAKAKQANFAALDMDLARVVCLCWTTDGKKLAGGIAKVEEEEAALLKRFWAETYGNRGQHTYVGFNILDFDLPLLIRRSQYLDVSYPQLELGRYRHPGIIDLMQILTWDGKVNYRRLEFYCKRFGVEGPEDKHTGADVPNLVLLQDWQSVKRHCAADVIKEWRLGVRLGVIEIPKGIDFNEQAF